MQQEFALARSLAARMPQARASQPFVGTGSTPQSDFALGYPVPISSGAAAHFLARPDEQDVTFVIVAAGIKSVSVRDRPERQADGSRRSAAALRLIIGSHWKARKGSS